MIKNINLKHPFKIVSIILSHSFLNDNFAKNGIDLNLIFSGGKQ